MREGRPADQTCEIVYNPRIREQDCGAVAYCGLDFAIFPPRVLNIDWSGQKQGALIPGGPSQMAWQEHEYGAVSFDVGKHNLPRYSREYKTSVCGL